MLAMTLTEWSHIAQIVVTIVTAIGVVASLFYSRSALREVHTDRWLRQKPHLAFEAGALRLPVILEKAGTAIPGINPSYVKKLFPNLPDGAESVRLKQVSKEKQPFYGKLRNYGLGPALGTKVVWLAEAIWIGSEKFDVDEAKRREPLYMKELNTMPAHSNHILPGQHAELTRIPTFVEKDHEKKVTRVDGVLHITCDDIFGSAHTAFQKFRCFVGYGDNPYFHVVFSDVTEKPDYV